MKKMIYNPFERIGGYTALGIGLVVIFITSCLASLSLLHFDGIIDMHFGGDSSLCLFFIQNLVNLIVITLVFYFIGIFISPSRIRLLDIIGTQALARTPMLLPASFACLINIKKYNEYIITAILHDNFKIALTFTEWVLVVLLLIIVLISIIWMIVLMFNAYSISTNIKGTKLTVSFIIGIIIAEVITKLINFFLLKTYIINDPFELIIEHFSK
ncbi:hypothetical protein ACFL6I_26945 [candidate division KSB1 bacterium]